MNSNLTEIVFVLDRSGSMSGLEQDTIGGFNSMLQKQKAETGDAIVSTVLFDHECQVIHDRVPIDKVEPLTQQQYFTRGSTALLDALGGAIHHIANVHKYAREEDRPEKTIFIITTDGFENASRRYTAERVRSMVKHEQEKYGWEFLFLGANIDAITVARDYGIAADRAVRYECDERGTELSFDTITTVLSSVRRREDIAPGWKASIEKDYKNRGKK